MQERDLPGHSVHRAVAFERDRLVVLLSQVRVTGVYHLGEGTSATVGATVGQCCKRLCVTLWRLES